MNELVQDVNDKNLNGSKQNLTEVNLVRKHKIFFNELMKKLASLLTD